MIDRSIDTGDDDDVFIFHIFHNIVVNTVIFSTARTFFFRKRRKALQYIRTFSLLISTTARSPTALAILLARVLNAPHCLQASTVTVFLSDDDDDEESFDFDIDFDLVWDLASPSSTSASEAAATGGSFFFNAATALITVNTFFFFAVVVEVLVDAAFFFGGGLSFFFVAAAAAAGSASAAAAAAASTLLETRADLLVPTMMD